MKKLLILTAITFGVAGCETKETMKTKLTENLDTTYKAGEDFFQYATGGWQNANPITDEYARYGQFDALREKSREQLKELVLDEILHVHRCLTEKVLREGTYHPVTMRSESDL